MNRGDAEDAEKAVKARFCDQHAARNPDLPTIQQRSLTENTLRALRLCGSNYL